MNAPTDHGLAEMPLSGVRVADFTHMVAGPSAAMSLADLGASVVKFEMPQGGDPSRRLGSGGTMFTAMNRNKRSVVLDLKDARGQEIARRFIATCDVVLESLRPGVMEGWGLGYEQISTLCPGVVYGSVVGFGSHGPQRDRGGVDLVVQAESGMMKITGDPSGPPMKVGFQVVDTLAGVALGQGVIAALLRRARTGKGGRVEVRLLDCALYLQAFQIAEYSVTGQLPTQNGNSVPHAAPSDLVRTSDGYLMIAAYLDDQWKRLCATLELDWMLSDARFVTNDARRQNRAALVSELEARLITRTAEEWFVIFSAANVLAARVRDYGDVFADPQVAENGCLVTVQSNDRDVTTVQLPYVLDDRARPAPASPPALGADTEGVLVELGYDGSEIDAFIAQGVVGRDLRDRARP